VVKTQGWTSKNTELGVVLTDGSGEYPPSTSLVELLHILCDEDSEGRIHFAWDLDVFVAPLLQLLDEATLKYLVHEHWLKIANFGKILYIPSKVFGIYQFDEKPISIYSLNQYFISLEDPKDANKIWGLANILMTTLNSMGINAKSFTSPAKIYEEGILNRCSIPTAFDIKDKECVEYAWHCCGRPWIECFQIGYFDTTWDIDRTSSYPAEMTKLQNTNHAIYRKSNTMIENADWGFLKGKITINKEVKVSPITRRLPDGSIINPSGSWDDFITLDAVKFIYKWGIGTFKLYDGWFLNFTSEHKPLELPMKKLFGFRGEKDLKDQLAKRMANGAIGKFTEEHVDKVTGIIKEYGKYYNPLYAALVQERTRLEVGRFIYVNKLQVKDLVAVNTDGVLSTKDVGMKLDPDKPRKMGGWRLTDIGPAIAESSGNVFHADKKPHGITYSAILESIEAEPNKSYYDIKGLRLVTINDIIDGKAGWNELGKMKEFATASVDLVKLMAMAKTNSLDRVFSKMPQTGKDLLENHYPSGPIVIGE
jgi:hypothetical protein